FGRNLVRSRDGKAVNISVLVTQGAGALVEDSKGGIWIGTRDRGLAYYRDERTTLYPMAEAVQALLVDHEGGLWVGTSNGLLHRTGDCDFARVGTESGLTSTNVTALLEDRDHNLWVGTAGGGLNRFAGGRWTHI